jgi:hypothetical protein
MQAVCNDCRTETRVALRRGTRLADSRCSCGGPLQRARSAGPSASAGKRFGRCPVCGKKRLEGRPCFYHAKEEVGQAVAQVPDGHGQKVHRCVRVLCEASRINPATFVRIDVTRGNRTEMAWYWMHLIPADFGTAFRIEKAATADSPAETYCVNLNGSQSSCECKGFLAHGHCKHIDALNVLIVRGKLPTANQ